MDAVQASDWNDTVVGSWDELQAELHSNELMPIQPEEGEHRRSDYLFRGMSDCAWPLQTSPRASGCYASAAI